MKEPYVTPDLYFEDFRLSQSIAAGCNTSVTDMLYQNGTGYFGQGSLTSCVTPWTSDESAASEGYCYWNGTIKLFTS